jgi:hypothetical protein
VDGFLQPKFIDIDGREVHLVMSTGQLLALRLHVLAETMYVGLGGFLVFGYYIAAKSILI